MSASEGQLTSPQQPAGALRVLVAEGGTFNQRLAVRLLEKLGHHAVVAVDGHEAVKRFEIAAFHLVLLDSQLPGLDAAETAVAIRGQEASSGERVPIIEVASDGESEVHDSDAINGTISRPLQASSLSLLIDQHCLVAAPTPGSRPTIDWNEALELVEGRESLLRELVEIFLAEYSSLVEQISTAISSDHAKNLQIYAHGLKGCLRYFGQTAAVRVAAHLEKVGEAGQISEAQTLLPELKDAVNDLIPELKAFIAK